MIKFLRSSSGLELYVLLSLVLLVASGGTIKPRSPFGGIEPPKKEFTHDELRALLEARRAQEAHKNQPEQLGQQAE